MNHVYDSHDREHFRDLMREFPVSNQPTVTDALKVLHTRYDKLNADHFVSTLSCTSIKNFSRLFSYLPLILNSYLFNGIVSNHEYYRRITDNNYGVVYFGPNSRFEGYQPQHITNGVRSACSCLNIDEKNAIHNAVQFYQQFVMIHPFYDANGRIGRFIVEVYLNFHGFGIIWKKLCANTKWIRKLNECHKRFDGPEYERYLNYLVEHWKKFIFEATNN